MSTHSTAPSLGPAAEPPSSATVALAYLNDLATKNRAGVEAVLADDVVHTTPFSSTGGLEPFLHLVGKAAVLAHADSIAHRYARMTLRDVVVTPAADPDVVFVEAVGDMVVLPAEPYANRYLYKLRVRDGLVTEIWEYANPVTFAVVNDLPLGPAPDPASSPATATDGAVPELAGIHHLKLGVRDLAVAQHFYETVLDARRVPEADHHDDQGQLYAVICSVPGLGTLLELRLDPEAAARQAGFDPVTIAVRTRADLDAWSRRLDDLGVPRSGRLTGIQAWLVAFDDPDHHRLRLYTLEQHGSDLAPTTDDAWLTNVVPAQPAP